MTRILDILEAVLEQIKKDNPYGLVLKGGTALALHHLNRHRESEDLDFDLDRSYLDKTEDVAAFIINILNQLERESFLKTYIIRKQGMASTNRYHMNLTLETYKPFYTKIDFDFVDLPNELEYDGKLGFYTIERMFVAKLLTFAARKELKDFYDISGLVRNIDKTAFNKPEKLAKLIGTVVEISEDDKLVASYRKTLREIDLKFKNLKESNLASFTAKTQRDLRIFRNELQK